MESCTGGELVNHVTNTSGASEVLKVSLVTYSNEYKIKFGVEKNIINSYTVYSKQVAKCMAESVSNFANSTIGVGVTGELENEGENDIYYCIYNKEANKYIEQKITLQKEERPIMKQKIADNIFAQLILNLG